MPGKKLKWHRVIGACLMLWPILLLTAAVPFAAAVLGSLGMMIEWNDSRASLYLAGTGLALMMFASLVIGLRLWRSSSVSS